MKLEIYGQESCLWCTRARNLCEANGYPYVYRDISDPEVRAEFNKRTNNAKTVPQILCGSIYIGSYEEFKVMVDTGRIQQVIGGQ